MNAGVGMNMLVCGGFGFAGHYLVYGLLKQGYQLILPAREKESQSLQARLQILKDNNKRVNRNYHIDESLFENVSVFKGDLSAENLGFSDEDLGYLTSVQIDAIFNFAACLHYEDEYRDECQRTNVEGTRRLLDLAILKKCRYIHASTAYITGNEIKSGEVIKEQFYDSDQFPNGYIESKAEAEYLIREYADKYNLDYFIFRLPTLIGDSETGFTNSLFGYYEYLAALSAIQRKGYNEELIRFSASPDGTVNLLPVDMVIDCLLEIYSGSDYKNRIFNLTDKNPLSPSELTDMMNKLFGLNLSATDSPVLESTMTRTEKLFACLTRRNAGFAQRVYRFDCKNSEGALGHPVADGWDKSEQYYRLLIKGYENYLSFLKDLIRTV
jgi:nucleoside-diphosphate-sugar epimerase